MSKDGRGRLKEVTELLNEGANPRATTKEGLNVLHLAIRNKHIDCIQQLLNSDADINSRTPP